MKVVRLLGNGNLLVEFENLAGLDGEPIQTEVPNSQYKALKEIERLGADTARRFSKLMAALVA